MGFLIGKVADRTGISVSAIRFYEEKGLVSSERNSGGQRIFEASDIRRISFIIIAQKLGFSLAEIAEQLDALPDNRTPSKKDWSKISRSFRDDIDRRIEGLLQLREKLDGCIGCGCLSLKVCKIYNENDRAAENGPGARYLMGDIPSGSKTP